MRCHYEVLDVSFDVNAEELKKAYRKAALRWHPDKNPADIEEAKKQFQLVQQAYEVLSDSHERAWYDAHRDAILKGGLGENYKDDSLNVYPYFTTSCYSGYGDDDKGFYAVYREVFHKIAAEDLDYMSASDDPLDIPSFGTSTSDFNEVVSRFYKYWQDYITKKSYSWLDEYDIKDLPNRRIAKLVEKENKKIRDRARKERSEEIRNLVAFVRKRDKRIQAHSKLMEIQAEEKAKKAAEKKRAKIKERQEELQRSQQTTWARHNDMEAELKNLEQSLCDDQEEEDNDALFCIACNKLFKTTKSFANHENSKKHKENIKDLKQQMLEEEEEFEKEESDKDSKDSEENSEIIDNVLENVADFKLEDSTSEGNDSCPEDLLDDEIDTDKSSEPEIESVSAPKKNKKNKKKVLIVNDSDHDKDMDEISMLPRRQRKKVQEKNVSVGNNVDSKDGDLNNFEENPSSKSNKKKEKKEARKQKRAEDELDKMGKTSKDSNVMKQKKDVSATNVPSNVDHCCVTCNTNFSSKNKLFEHLKSSGHSVYLPSKGIQGNVKKGKVKQK